MNHARLLVNILLLVLLPYWAFAQGPDADDDELDLEGILVESAMGETNGTSLILDNSRTKVGRDFYDLFYKHWSALPTQADTTQRRNAGPTDSSGDVVILVDELPSPGTANQILISIDDQPVWQQFVQGRYELLEADAHDAVDVVRQYLTAYQETQQQLGTQDQKGSGVH